MTANFGYPLTTCPNEEDTINNTDKI